MTFDEWIETQEPGIAACDHLEFGRKVWRAAQNTERERCAEIAEAMANECDSTAYADQVAAGLAEEIAKRIRDPEDDKDKQELSLECAVTKYWRHYYMEDHCTLCGNHGLIDTRGTKTMAGVAVGRVNYCICPNGQALRAGNAKIPDAK